MNYYWLKYVSFLMKTEKTNMKKKRILISIGIALFLNSFIANAQTNKSCVAFLKEHTKELKNHSFFVFPQVREKPIQWFDSIPTDKSTDFNHTLPFQLHGQSGEFFVFQTGILATKSNLNTVKVSFSPFIGNNKQIITASKMTCFNAEGVDFKGRFFNKKISVRSGRVQSLWMGIDLAGVKEGSYKGEVTVVSGKESQKIPFDLTVSGTVANHGYDEGKRLARLNWLNSTLGIDNAVTKYILKINNTFCSKPIQNII